MYMSGLEISKTIFPFSKGHQIAIENNCFNHAYISIAYGDLCMVETVRRCSRGGGGGIAPPPPKKKKWTYFSLADIGDFRAHIFYPQTTQELLNMHHDAGTLDQLTPDHCHKSITDTLDTVKINSKEVYFC